MASPIASAVPAAQQCKAQGCVKHSSLAEKCCESRAYCGLGCRIKDLGNHENVCANIMPGSIARTALETLKQALEHVNKNEMIKASGLFLSMNSVDKFRLLEEVKTHKEWGEQLTHLTEIQREIRVGLRGYDGKLRYSGSSEVRLGMKMSYDGEFR